MNKLEKDILDSEMGLYSNPPKTDESEKEEVSPKSDEEPEQESETPPVFTEDGIQLKIDDMFFEKPLNDGDEDKFFEYGYQDELDISSLGHLTEDDEPPKKEKGFLSSLLPDLSKEDLILIGIIIALAFDLADRDILLVALVAAAVIM